MTSLSSTYLEYVALIGAHPLSYNWLVFNLCWAFLVITFSIMYAAVTDDE